MIRLYIFERGAESKAGNYRRLNQSEFLKFKMALGLPDRLYVEIIRHFRNLTMSNTSHNLTNIIHKKSAGGLPDGGLPLEVGRIMGLPRRRTPKPKGRNREDSMLGKVVLGFVVGAIIGVVVPFVLFLLIGAYDGILAVLPYTALFGGIIAVLFRGIKYVIDMPGYESTEKPQKP